MSKKQFTLDNLRELDFGVLTAAFGADLAYAVKDCMDRPGEEKPRTIGITFKLIPVSNNPAHHECDNIALEVEIKSTVPARRTRPFMMDPIKNGDLMFNPDSPDDPDRRTLYDAQEREDDERHG